MKRTEGEWKIEVGNYPNGYFLQTVVDEQEAEGNAKLMAAAPELLAFAIEMVKRYPNSPWILEQGNAAIKKATE